MLILFFSCNTAAEKEGQMTYILKPSPTKKDSTTKWLLNPRNLQDTNYPKIFQSRLQNEIQRNLYDSAAVTLFNVGNALDVAYQFDSIYLGTCLKFTQKYATKISADNQAMISYYIGSQYDFRGKKDSSSYWLKKSKIPTNDYLTAQTIGFGQIILAEYYRKEGTLDSAIAIYLENINLYERLRDTLNLGVVYSNLHGVYASMDAYQEAQNCLNKGIHFAIIARDTPTIFNGYLNRAIDNYHLNVESEMTKNIDSMQFLYQKWQPQSLHYQFYANCFTALKYVRKSQYKKAKPYLDTCRVLWEKTHNPIFQGWYLNINAEYEIKSGKGISDLPSFEHFFAESNDNISAYALFSSTQQLADNAYLKGDYKKAFQYDRKATTFRDSVWNLQMLGRTFELEKKYQTAKKEQQILLQEQKISAKNSLILLLFVSLIALLVSVLAFILWQKQKQANKENQQHQAFMRQLWENTEDERRRIAYDLHDSIGHELLNLKHAVKTDVTSTTEKIDTILAEVRGISRNLHPVMFDKVGLQISVEQLVEHFQANEDVFVTAEISYKDKSLPAYAELQMYRIIQEALSNVRKYAQAHAAKVSISTHTGYVSLEIKDNGKGFDVQETLDKGKAFGLFSILERSKAIGGKAQILSQATGTTVLVQVPIGVRDLT